MQSEKEAKEEGEEQSSACDKLKTAYVWVLNSILQFYNTGKLLNLTHRSFLYNMGIRSPSIKLIR